MVRPKILHVTETSNDEVRQILGSLGEADRFDVHQVAFHDFSSVGWRALNSCAAVVFGISDGYYVRSGKLSSQATAALIRFVGEGGGVLLTHDTLPALPDLFETSGFHAREGMRRVPLTVSAVRILKPQHQAMQWPYPVAAAPAIREKGAHTTGSYSHPPPGIEAAAADILIDHNTDPSGPHNYYLAVNSYGQGRVALLEIGHAEIERFAGWETRLFVDVLCWVCSVRPPGSDDEKEGKENGAVPSARRAVLGAVERLALSASLTVGTAALLLHFLDRKHILGAAANLVISVVAGFIVWWVTRTRES